MRISDWSSDVCSSDLDGQLSRRALRCGRARLRTLDVEIGDRQRIFLNELAARLHHIAHQLGENLVRQIGLTDLHLQHRAVRLIERGFPKLRSEEHTSELQSLMRISYAVFCLNKKSLT